MQLTRLHALILSLCLLSAAFLLATVSVVVADPGDGAGSALSAGQFNDRWAGLYAGINADLVGTVAEINRGPGIGNYTSNQANAMFGVHLGYNLAPYGNGRNGGWMFGAEVDASVGRFSKRKADRVLGAVELDGRFLASARLRGGYAWESFFLYGTAGLALTDIDVKPARAGNDIRAGLAVGIGAEYALNDNWTARFEAVGYRFGDDKHRFAGTGRTVDFDMAKLRVGFSRRF